MRKRNASQARAVPRAGDLRRLLEPRFFKALGDRNRVALLARLARCGRPCTVSELTACCPVDISVVSRHLGLLRDAGILDSEKRGKQVYYSVSFPELVNTLRRMAEILEACCAANNRQTEEPTHE